MLPYFICIAIATTLDMTQIIKENQGRKMLIVYVLLVLIGLGISIYYFMNIGKVSISQTVLKLVGDKK